MFEKDSPRNCRIAIVDRKGRFVALGARLKPKDADKLAKALGRKGGTRIVVLSPGGPLNPVVSRDADLLADLLPSQFPIGGDR